MFRARGAGPGRGAKLFVVVALSVCVLFHNFPPAPRAASLTVCFTIISQSEIRVRKQRSR